jgi:hypothetical protein
MKNSMRGGVSRLLARWGFRSRSLTPSSAVESVDGDPYDRDGLITAHNHRFMEDPGFVRAYGRGTAAAEGQDFRNQWRIHVGLWAAWCANRLEGDYVECGVSWGCLSSAIMESLDWNRGSRTFYLLDTFSGVDESLLTEAEQVHSKAHYRFCKESGAYALDVESVRRNFAQWRGATVIQGRVPDTLVEVKAEKIAFLHLDMNCATPEIAAAEALWPRIVPGGMILLDDFAYKGFEPQYEAFQEFAKRHDQHILSLPTGQGLMIR